ncbi:MAG: transcriptional regulator with XRE-family HTH domain [Granulosicoccus sp.]
MNIKRLRTLSKLSQKEVCATAEIPQGQYSVIENGKVTPTFPTLEKLAKVFGVSLVEFFQINDPGQAMNLPMLEKIKLLDQLGEEEKEALLKVIDMAVANKKLKDNLSDLLAS